MSIKMVEVRPYQSIGILNINKGKVPIKKQRE